MATLLEQSSDIYVKDRPIELSEHNLEQSSDIYVKDHPIGLSERNPTIFQDYAISIMPSMETLIADPTFRRNVEETLGTLTVIDIKVRGEDGAVLVKNPHDPNSCYQKVDSDAQAAVQQVAHRTQLAYNRLVGPPASSYENSPKKGSSPIDHPVPSSIIHPEFYESRIRDLENRNKELRERIENLELASQTENSKPPVKKCKQEPNACGIEIDLQKQLKDAQQKNKRYGQELLNVCNKEINLRKQLQDAQQEKEKKDRELSSLKTKLQNNQI